MLVDCESHHTAMQDNHFLLLTNFIRQVRSSCCCSATKSCLTLWDPMDCSTPGSSVHRISQSRILAQVAISFSRVSLHSRDGTHVSCTAGRSFTIEPPGKPLKRSRRWNLCIAWWNDYLESKDLGAGRDHTDQPIQLFVLQKRTLRPIEFT
jgi:hypothetical protein